MSQSDTRSRRAQLSEEEIDELVIAEADDDSAWGRPIRVSPTMPNSFSIPQELAARAGFVARLHRARALEEWLTRVIRERVELEETAFAAIKREIGTRARG